jgi:hypothetical protein
LKFTLAILVAVLSFTGSVQAGLEAVYVKKVIDSKDEVIIQRRNGEVWLLEYGVGVISLWRYEGQAVLIKFPGMFGGVGGEIILADDDETATIWNAEEIE